MCIRDRYVRTREMGPVKATFADLLARLRTDYIDLGMIHFVDEVKEYHQIMEGEFLQYALELKRAGTIRHIGMSTHNPAVGKLAAQSGVIEMILFSVNPAFDLLPANEVLDDYFVQETYDGALHGIDPVSYTHLKRQRSAHPEKKTAPEPRVPLITGSSSKCGAARATTASAPMRQTPLPVSARITLHILGQLLHKYSIGFSFRHGRSAPQRDQVHLGGCV